MNSTSGTMSKWVFASLGTAAIIVLLYQTMGETSVRDKALVSTLANEIRSSTSSDATLANPWGTRGTPSLEDDNTKRHPNGCDSPTSSNSTARMEGDCSDLPSSTSHPNNKPTNPWGGAIAFAANPSNRSQSSIAQSAIPADTCAKMVSNPGNAVSSLTVNGVTLTLPVSPDIANTVCNRPANDITMTVKNFQLP